MSLGTKELPQDLQVRLPPGRWTVSLDWQSGQTYFLVGFMVIPFERSGMRPVSGFHPPPAVGAASPGRIFQHCDADVKKKDDDAGI